MDIHKLKLQDIFQVRLLDTVAILLLLQGFHCLKWENSTAITIDHTLRKCEGETVVFPWHYRLEDGESAVGISWLRDLSGAEVAIIANLFVLNNKFESLLLNERERVSRSQEGAAGLQLSQVTTNDTGNYTVIVRLDNGDTSSQTVSLLVYAKPEAASNRLNVTAVHSADGHQGSGSHRELKCGRFTSLGTPAVTVSWQDSEENELPSSRYEDGFFFLDIEQYKDGNFKCSLREDLPAMGCLPPASGLKEEAMLTVSGRSLPVSSEAGIGAEAVAGVVIAVILLVAVAMVIAVFLIRSKRGKSYAPKEPESPEGEDNDVEHPDQPLKG